jgi:hypothetical protein
MDFHGQQKRTARLQVGLSADGIPNRDYGKDSRISGQTAPLPNRYSGKLFAPPMAQDVRHGDQSSHIWAPSQIWPTSENWEAIKNHGAPRTACLGEEILAVLRPH